MDLLNIFIFLAIIGIAKGADVTCSFGSEVPFPRCNLFNITKVASANEDITILGQPSDYVDIYTTYLPFNQDSVINFIPTKMLKYFPNLDHIFVQEASLTTLVEDAFNYCQNLRLISIYKNSLSHIPSRFASTCFAVINVNLNSNGIKTIDERAFEGLESLDFLSLAFNEITCIPPKLFQSCLGLSTIDLSHNSITALHSDLIRNLTLLMMFNLPYNQISYIPNFNMAHTGTVRSGVSIGLSSNPIKAISPKFLYDVYNSRDIYGGMSTSLHFHSYELETCLDLEKYPESSNYFNIAMFNWIRADVFYKYRSTCYSNWNSEMASNSLVTCGSTA